MATSGAVLSFRDLEFSVPLNGNKTPASKLKCLFKKENEPKRKIILKSISGVFRPGKVSVIMGPSGGGKTSLLSCMAGIALGGTIKGTLRVNGRVVSPKVLRAISGFVHQDDVIMETMTVHEGKVFLTQVLKMSLKLRNPKLDEAEATRRLETTLNELGLSKARNTVIGSSFVKGVSGGERKRTAIGMELMSQSPVLFLDECTSGLDSFTAYAIMGVLKTIASKGTTVIATLHQPSSEIFELIDDLVILVSGSVLYNGAANQMVEYFADLGYKCPAYNNPPDYIFMQVINNNTEEKITEIIKKSTILGVKALEDAESTFKTSQEPLAFKYFPSVFQQIKYLSPRAWKNNLRNPMMLRARLMQSLVISLFIGALFFKIEDSGSISQVIQGTTGVLFFVATNLFIGGAIATMSMFSTERAVFIREYSSGYYNVFSYFFAKNIVEFPFQVLFPVVFASIAYWMIYFSGDGIEYLIFTAACILLNFTGISYGIFIGSVFEDINVALSVLPVSILPMMLMGGLLVNADTAPAWLYWMKWISPVNYAFCAFMRNYLEGAVIKRFSGDDILKNFGVTVSYPAWMNYLFLFIITVVAEMMAFLGLRRLALKRGGRPFISERSRQKWSQPVTE